MFYLFFVVFLTFEDAVRRSLSNLNVLAMEDEVLAQEYLSRKSFSDILPKFFANFSYTRVFKLPEIEIQGRRIEVGRKDQSSLSFGAQMVIPLDYTPPFFAKNYLLQSEKRNLSSKKYELEYNKNQIAFQVGNIFISILKLKEMEKLILEQMKAMEENLNIAKNLFREGLITEADVSRIEAGLYNISASYEDVKKNLENLKNQLGVLIGEEKFEIEGSIDEIFERYSKEEFSYLQRWDILSLEESLESLRNLRLFQRSQFLPQIVLGFSFLNTFGTFVEQRMIPNLSVQISFSFFEWGSTYFSYLSIKRREMALEKRLAFLKQQAKIEFENSLREIISLQKKLESAKKSLESSEKALEVSRELFKEGKIRSIDLMDTQIQYISSAINVTSIKGDIVVAVLKTKLLGGQKIIE